MTDERCSICGAEYGPPKRKFNGGNPVMVRYPECTCEEDAVFEEVMRRIKNGTGITENPSPDAETSGP